MQTVCCPAPFAADPFNKLASKQASKFLSCRLAHVDVDCIFPTPYLQYLLPANESGANTHK